MLLVLPCYNPIRNHLEVTDHLSKLRLWSKRHLKKAKALLALLQSLRARPFGFRHLITFQMSFLFFLPTSHGGTTIADKVTFDILGDALLIGPDLSLPIKVAKIEAESSRANVYLIVLVLPVRIIVTLLAQNQLFTNPLLPVIITRAINHFSVFLSYRQLIRQFTSNFKHHVKYLKAT